MSAVKVIILGGIGTAVNIAEQMIDARERFGLKDEFIGFAFDNESFGSTINGFPLLCKTYDAFSKFGKHNDVRFIYQLYRPDKLMERTALLHSFNIPVNRFYNFIHPLSTVVRSARIGVGNAIHAGCVLNSNAVIGNHNTLNSGCLIGHDTTVGNNSFFAAQSCIGSNTKIGDCVFVGLNAAVNNMVRIGDNVMIGMGSNVVKSFDSDQLVLGNPAKHIKPLSRS